MFMGVLARFFTALFVYISTYSLPKRIMTWAVWHLGNIQKCFKAPLFPVVYRPPPPFPPFHHYTFIFNFEMAFSENASYKICNTPSFRSGASSFATLRDPLSSERNCNEYKLESLSNTASENLNFRTVYKHHQKCKKHKEIFLLNSMVCAY